MSAIIKKAWDDVRAKLDIQRIVTRVVNRIFSNILAALVDIAIDGLTELRDQLRGVGPVPTPPVPPAPVPVKQELDKK